MKQEKNESAKEKQSRLPSLPFCREKLNSAMSLNENSFRILFLTVHDAEGYFIGQKSQFSKMGLWFRPEVLMLLKTFPHSFSLCE